jgi:hypothetical protein
MTSRATAGSDLDDGEARNAAHGLEIVVLSDHRQSAGGGDGGNPQVIDPDATPRLGEVHAHLRPCPGSGLVYRERLHVSDGLQGLEPTGASIGIAGCEHPGVQLGQGYDADRGFVREPVLIYRAS